MNAQDPQFTQFYSAPLNLNPAFVGATPCWRAMVNYRNQWFLAGESNANYNTINAAIDYNFRRPKVGLGGYIINDRASIGGFTSYEFAPMVSKEVKIKDELKLRFGIQPSYHLRYLTPGNYTFGDQYTNLQPIGGSADGARILSAINFFDISAGTVLYSDRFWIGIAGHHLMNNTLVTPSGIIYVPTKLSVHGGMKFELNDANESVIKPAANLKLQGAHLQLDLGFYYERSQYIFGAWYRGIPLINSTSAAFNQDAIALLFGMKISSFKFGYSYDLPLSKMIYSLGSHELSACFEFCFDTGKHKPPRYIRELPCPDF